MQRFAGVIASGASPSRSVQGIFDEMKCRASTAAAHPQLQAAVSKAKKGVVVASSLPSSVVGVAGDVAKQGVAVARQRVDSAKESLGAIRHSTCSLTPRGIKKEQDEANAERIQELVAMGFDPTDAARAVTQVKPGDLAAAVKILYDERAAASAETKSSFGVRTATVKAMLKKEHVKTKLKFHHAEAYVKRRSHTAWNAKRRAEAYVRGRFSKGCVDQAEAHDSSEDSETLQEFEVLEILGSTDSQGLQSMAEIRGESSTSSEEASDPCTTAWSLKPSVGTWLLLSCQPEESEDLAAEVVPKDGCEAMAKEVEMMQPKHQIEPAKAMPIRGGA